MWGHANHHAFTDGANNTWLAISSTSHYSVTSPPPFNRNLTAPGGVNLITGQIELDNDDISVGDDDGQAKIVLKRTLRTNLNNNSIATSMGSILPYGGFSHNYNNYIINGYNIPLSQSSGFSWSGEAVILGKTYHIIMSAQGIFSDAGFDGAMFNEIAPNGAYHVYQLLTPDGMKVIFEASRDFLDDDKATIVAKYLEYPDGEFLTFQYDETPLPYASTSVMYQGALDVSHRIKQITNSRGYGLSFSYLNNATTGARDPAKNIISTITSFKTICSSSCTQDSIASVNYQYTAVSNPPYTLYQLNKFTSTTGVYTSYSSSASGNDASISISTNGRSTPDITFNLSRTWSSISDSAVGFYVRSIVDSQNKTTTYQWTMANFYTDDLITDPLGHQTLVHSNYDPTYGNPITNQPVPQSIKDPLNNITSYSYDSYSRLTAIQYPDLNSESQILDDRGNATSIRKIAKPGSGLSDIVSSTGFPACDLTNYRICNQPSYEIDGRGNRTDYAYDATSGGLLVKLDPADTNGKRSVTRFAYGSFAAASGIYVPSGLTPALAWLKTTEDQCLSSSVTGTVIDFTYVCPPNDLIRTAFNRTPSSVASPSSYPLTSIVADPTGFAKTVSFTYDQTGNLATVDGEQTGGADTTSYIYDSDRRLTQITFPTVNGVTPVTKYTYDDYGHRTLAQQSLNGGWVNMSESYDTRGLKISSTGIDGIQESYSYYDDGRLKDTSKTVDGTVRTTRNIYDAAARLIQIRKAVGTDLEQAYVTWTYNANGKKLSEQDAQGNIVTSCYDGFDRRVELRFPAGTAVPGTAPACSSIGIGGALPSGVTREAYGYDNDGNQTMLTRRTGATISMSYDGLNRMSFKAVPETDRDVTYSYDLAGRRTAATLPGTNAALSVGWSYDKVGRLVTETMNDRTATHEYDSGFQWQQLAWPGTDALTVRTTVDAMNRVASVQELSGPTLASYQYDGLSRRLSVSRGNTTSTAYGYDAQQRLSTFGHTFVGSSVAFNFTYNEAGQAKTISRDSDAYAWTGSYNVVRGYGANALNQYTYSGADLLGYDASGNLTTDAGAAYSYDSDNRLISAVYGTATGLLYDAIGRLASVSSGNLVTNFLYDGDELIGEYDANGAAIRRYAHGPDPDEPLVMYEAGGRSWIYADYQQSVIAAAGSGGSVAYVNAYDEYGIAQYGNHGRFGYTGQLMIPEIGSIYYYKARFYSPSLGRFLQVDPVGTGDQINLYAYVANDPANHTDFSGDFQEGTGFTKELWNQFNQAQQQAAKDMDNRAGKLDTKADKMDAKQAGSGSVLRKEATNLQAGAAALRDTSPSAAKANLVADGDWAAVHPGGSTSSQAFTSKDGKSVFFRDTHLGVFGADGPGAKWTIGHEGIHSSTRLPDQLGPNGFSAYLHGTPPMVDSYNKIKGTMVGANNPDNLMGVVYGDIN